MVEETESFVLELLLDTGENSSVFIQNHITEIQTYDDDSPEGIPTIQILSA